MTTKSTPRRGRGFTLIELMVVVALAAVVVGLAAPSFIKTLAKKRLEGIAAELGTDLQFARSEAVRLNARVRVIAGASCYTIHAVANVGATDATDCATLGTGATPLKSVTLDAGGTTSLALTSNNGKAFLEFDPVRGMAVDSTGGDSSGYITASSSAGNWQLRADVTQFGRVKSCSPNNSIPGMPACS